MGSFSLIVEPAAGSFAVVGEPDVISAQVRADRLDGIACVGPSCILKPAAEFVAGLGSADNLMLQVTGRRGGSFEFSADLAGYRAGLAQIKAWGHATMPPRPGAAKPKPAA